jgi:hypothetical protein
LINSGGPFFPARKAFTLRIMPGKKGADNRAMPIDKKDSILIPLNITKFQKSYLPELSGLNK